MESLYQKPNDISAFEAKFQALKISFAPIVFQVSVSLVRLGILDYLNKKGEYGATIEGLAREIQVSEYGIGVLLDVALSARIIWQKGDHYIIDKIGMMLISDEMIKVNLDFVNDVCYKGLFHLTDAIQLEKPTGLKEFGDWPTIYPALSSLPEKAQNSWFAFDHYYSDKSFNELINIVFNKPIKSLLDVGGNTGKWAKACLEHDQHVKVCVADLPEQIKLANKYLSDFGLSKHFSTYEIDLLDRTSVLPRGYDVIWMSQFLDCFSKINILEILKKVKDAMGQSSRLYILDLFWDRQAYEPATYAINCISIYFTAMANGKSRLYHSKDFIELINKAGLEIESEKDMIGPGHTLFICKKP